VIVHKNNNLEDFYELSNFWKVLIFSLKLFSPKMARCFLKSLLIGKPQSCRGCFFRKKVAINIH
jgi:hypothetical protein